MLFNNLNHIKILTHRNNEQILFFILFKIWFFFVKQKPAEDNACQPNKSNIIINPFGLFIWSYKHIGIVFTHESQKPTKSHRSSAFHLNHFEHHNTQHCLPMSCINKLHIQFMSIFDTDLRTMSHKLFSKKHAIIHFRNR